MLDIANVVTPTPSVEKEKVELPQEPKKAIVDKNKELKDRIFKEKGIILTDEDIKRYGITK